MSSLFLKKGVIFLKNAAAYVRVSTEKQDEYSLDSQIKLIRDYARQHDMILPAEYIFVEDGISGRHAKNRRAFQDMIALAKDKSHPFDVVLVWKFSRFARNQEESIFYKSMLSRSGVDVVSISETLDDSPFSSLIERIIEWMDEFYSIRLSGEVKRGMNEKISRSEIVTIPSFGYVVENKNYIPSDDADTVRRIFSDYLSGKGLTTIARELEAAGVKTRRGSAPSNRWVRYILQNPVYIGKIRWSTGGKIDYVAGEQTDRAVLVDGTFPPLVSVEDFEAVQEKLRCRSSALPYTRHDQSVEWMLKGLVRCSSCGATLVYAALSCPSMQCYKYAHGQCSVSHSLSISKANAALIAALENCIALEDFPLAPQIEKKSPPAGDYDRQIASVQLKLRRVLDAYEAGIDSLEEYAEKKKKLTAEIEAIRAKQADDLRDAAAGAMTPAEMRKRAADVLEIIRSPEISEQSKNEALRSILSYAVYEKSAGRLALYFNF